MAESTLLQDLLVHASGRGCRLFRNQVGSYQLPDGRWLSSGLCVGSSDLIGWTPVTVTPEMVGTTVALFTAIETKVGRRETTAQQAVFLARVRQAGGIGLIARSVTDLDYLLSPYAVAVVDR